MIVEKLTAFLTMAREKASFLTREVETGRNCYRKKSVGKSIK
jgi:hypothetical protein